MIFNFKKREDIKKFYLKYTKKNIIDYLVIGSGPAGITLTKNFLSQSPWGSGGPSRGDNNGSGSRREPPNLDELIGNLQRIIGKFLPGGKSGGNKPIILGLVIHFNNVDLQ